MGTRYATLAALGSAALGLALAACAGLDQAPKDTQASRVVAPSANAAANEVKGWLAQRGFEVSQPDAGQVQAQGGVQVSAWAECPRLSFDDPYADKFDRVGFATPQPTTAQVSVSLAPTNGGTRVTADAHFTGTYYNTYTSTQRQAPCSSTGELERSLVQAIQP